MQRVSQSPQYSSAEMTYQMSNYSIWQPCNMLHKCFNSCLLHSIQIDIKSNIGAQTYMCVGMHTECVFVHEHV